MPPPLALFLCAVFVLFLLRLERRASRDNSPALWIPTVWMLILASRPLATWFVDSGDVIRSNEAGSELDRWVLTALALAAMVVLLHRRIDWWGIVRQHKWLVLLLAYMFLSTFWSAITLIALRRWTRELIVLVMALVIISEVNPRQALESVLRRTAYVLVPLSVVLIKYYPLLGRAYGRFSGVEMWTGVTCQKNHLGRLCMISVLFLLWTLYERWRERPRVGGGRYQACADVSVIVIALYLLKGSDSSTSMVTLVLGVVIFLGLRLLRTLQFQVPLTGLVVLMIFLMTLGASTPFVGGSNVAAFTPALGRDETLTGRTGVWADVLPAISQEPLLGYGVGSFWTDARREHYDIPTAHNGYLDILLELGEVGFVFYLLWLLSCTRLLHRALLHDYEWGSLAICFFLMGLLYNISESALNTFTEQMTAVMILTCLVASCGIKPRSGSAWDPASDVETRARWRARETRPQLTGILPGGNASAQPKQKGFRLVQDSAQTRGIFQLFTRYSSTAEMCS
jgi:O-antigen ligase